MKNIRKTIHVLYLFIYIYLSERAKENNAFVECQQSVDDKAAAWICNHYSEQERMSKTLLVLIVL